MIGKLLQPFPRIDLPDSVSGLILMTVVLLVASCSPSEEVSRPEVVFENIATVPETTSRDTSELLPDLVLDFFWDITYTSDCPWGGPGFLIVRGRNAGGRDASEFQIQVWEQFEIIDALPSGEQVQVRFDFESGPVGSISAFIDPEDIVFESDESNNELLIVFTPPPKCTPATGS